MRSTKGTKIIRISLKVLNAMLYFVLAVLLLFNVYNLAARLIFKNDLPKVFGYANAVVISGSMSGTIEVDDMIIIKSQRSYEVGDIITYRADSGALVTHRVVESNKAGYVTRGDANNVNDFGIVIPERVEGKVVKTVRGAGKLIDFFKSPYGLAVVVIAGLAFIELPEIVSNISEKIKESKMNRAGVARVAGKEENA